jgi:hypothetical protein
MRTLIQFSNPFKTLNPLGLEAGSYSIMNSSNQIDTIVVSNDHLDLLKPIWDTIIAKGDITPYHVLSAINHLTNYKKPQNSYETSLLDAYNLWNILEIERLRILPKVNAEKKKFFQDMDDDLFEDTFGFIKIWTSSHKSLYTLEQDQILEDYYLNWLYNECTESFERFYKSSNSSSPKLVKVILNEFELEDL